MLSEQDNVGANALGELKEGGTDNFLHAFIGGQSNEHGSAELTVIWTKG